MADLHPDHSLVIDVGVVLAHMRAASSRTDLSGRVWVSGTARGRRGLAFFAGYWQVIGFGPRDRGPDSLRVP